MEKRLAAGERLPQLDGIRGLALLMVLLFHTFPAAIVPGIGGPLQALVSSMWVSIDLFFVLSGFLITGVLLELRDVPGRLRLFYARRTLRIFPLYFFVLTLSLWVLPRFALHSIQTLQPLWAWFYAYGLNVWIFRHNDWPAIETLNHFWSLAVEEQFYLVWPFLVFLAPPRWLPRLAVVLFGVALAAKLAFFSAGLRWPVLYTSSLTRLDTFAAGAIAAYAFAFGDPDRDRRWFRIAFRISAALAAAILVVLGGYDIVRSEVHLSVMPILAVLFGSGIYLAAVADPRWLSTRVLASRILVFFGKYSYGLYVYHWVVWNLVLEFLRQHRIATTDVRLFAIAACVATNAITVALAIPTYHWLELPCLNLRPRVSAARAASSSRVRAPAPRGPASDSTS